MQEKEMDWQESQEKESLAENLDINEDIPSQIDGQRAGKELDLNIEILEPAENQPESQVLEPYDGLDLVGIITRAISEKLGEDILVFDTREGSILMDFMIIASARNLRQNHSLVENVEDRLFEAGYKGRWHVEGNENSGWVLIDLGDIIVNLFTREERENYSLERLYQDCKSRRVE